MKLAVSSLAWDPHDDPAMRTLLSDRGVRGIELAPLKYWPSPREAGVDALAAYRAEWSDAGVAIVALQGILFGKPELRLFGTPEQRSALEAHLVDIADVAQGLGARVIVLGAPKNRLRGALSEEEAVESATPLLRRVASACADRGCVLCVEPNPSRYGGDFVRDIAEAVDLVRSVDHHGFGLHLDAGAIAIAGESDATIVQAARSARHFHISEVDLAPVGSGSVDHRHIGGLLRDGGYAEWVSIEMKPVGSALLQGVMSRAIDAARDAYGERSHLSS